MNYFSFYVVINKYKFYKLLNVKGDIMKVEIDWKDVVRNVLNVNEKTLNSLITVKNKKVKLWKMLDFSNKINELLKNGEMNSSKMTDSHISEEQHSVLIKDHK